MKAGRRRTGLGRRHRLYRVVVEKVQCKSIIVKAKSRDEAESEAYDIAGRTPEGWAEDGDMEIRDCTSVRTEDGSWEFCNALKDS